MATPSTIPYALVVDDNALIQMDASAILQDAGFRTVDAFSGDEAIPVLERSGEAIILLFTDVQMPGKLDGFALAHMVAQRWPHVAIVVASGQVIPTAGDLPIGARFISKPFTAQMVKDTVVQLLPDGQQPEPLRRAI